MTKLIVYHLPTISSITSRSHYLINKKWIKLQEFCKKNNAHLSKNSFKLFDNGQQQRFVTLRIYRLGRTNAEAQFDKVVEDLGKEGYAVESKMREYSVYDSNVRLDTGWIDQIVPKKHTIKICINSN